MNIRLAGYFDKNFGDDLMQLIVADGMPEYDFFADCPQKEFLTHFRGRKNVHLYDESVRIDAYVNVIGTGFKYASKMNILTKFLSIPYEKKPNHERAAVIDCSLDEPKSRAERFLVKRELNKYAYISCRDAVSEKIISNLAKGNRLVRHEDIVFALGDDYIYPKSGEDYLGVIPVQRGFSEENFGYYEAMAHACDRYVQKYNKNVLIFALDTGNENDTLAALTVKRLMKYAGRAEIIAYNGNPKYIFKNMARCDRVISSRFHGVIAAALAGVPASAVSDTSKINILSEKLGFEKIPKSGITADKLFALIERTDKAIAVSDSIREDAGLHLKGLERFLEEVSRNGKG